MSVEAEFSFEPRHFLVLDAVYLARPELRRRMMALLVLSGISLLATVVIAVAGAHLLLWLACLAVGLAALCMLAWWALGQTRGSVFVAGPATVHVDDHGLLVRHVGGEPSLLAWSALRAWGETPAALVLFPASRSGRPLHVIPAGDVERSDAAEDLRDLLRWHLGKPRT